MTVSIATLRKHLRLERKTGKLFRRTGLNAGKEAGCENGDGYLKLTVEGRHVYAHRVVWAMTKGAWPEGHIDHRNGIRSDNRFRNLRDGSRFQNQQNMRRSKANTSGATGVWQCPKTKRWRAQVIANGDRHYLGRFKTKRAATSAVKAKRNELGFSRRHGEAR